VVADAAFADISATETGVLAPLLALMIVLGVAPQLLIGLTNPLTTLWASGVLSP
jgi:NADH-quinone oxidoreductase subunit M